MRLRLLGGLGTVAAVGCLLAAPDAYAHPVTVDGNATEWFTRIPNADNLGLIARDATHQGEYVWRDNLGDARTDITSPEVVGDIAAFQATGTTDGIAFLVRRQQGVAFTGAPIQVQIAIDTDRVAGSGQEYFADFADTKVADGARWEYLVETLFGSGGTAAVKDTAFNAVASVPAVQGAGGDIEIFVPWTLLGMSGPPASPLRFTVATFRAQSNDQTIDIGGASISNAVDAVTDYGNPAAAAYPNTWIDVQDQVVDYSFDLWFSSAGEVYAPVVIQRFLANSAAGGSDEWYTIRNVTGSALSLSNFKLGDEETPDGTEGMKLFPAAATIAGGGTFTVAAKGTSYQTFYGVAPDAEIAASSVAIPDMTSFAAWATSPMALSNDGDELLLLDRSNTILDIAVYGSGVYAGITSYTPNPGAEIALQRDTQSSDTDDCKVDFSPGTQCGNNSHCGGSCRECVDFVCEPKAAGTSCADNDLCNGAETCDGTGACQTGAALDCNDSQPCTIDSCSASTGCVHVNEADGASCSNNDVCDGFEACDANGVCQSGTPLSCADANPCTVDTCDPTTGCAHAQAQPGTSCSDGDACNGAETCNSAGTCLSSGPLDCDDANPCTTDSCNTASGCEHTPLASGTACGNGNVCDGDETCNATGTCVAGTPLSCGDGNDCTTDSCDPSTGCAHANETVGTACTGSGCTGQCDSTGDCVCGTGGAGGAGGSGGTGGTAGAAGSGATGGAGGAAGTGGDGGAAGTAGAAGSAGTGGDGGAAGAGTGGAAGSAGTGGDGGAAGAATGGAAGSGGTGGATGGTGGATGGSGGASDAGVGGTGGSPSLPATSAPKDEGGCGCSTPGQSQAPSGYWLVAMMGAALTWMRSKAKRRSDAKD